MAIVINRIETTYPAPEGDEDYCPEGDSVADELIVSFRQLVDLMREHSHPSSSHLTGSRFEWFSSEPYQDPYTGEYTETSIHLAHGAPARMDKYWRAAMRAAGYRVNA